MKRRIGAILLAAVVLASLCTVGASAAESSVERARQAILDCYTAGRDSVDLSLYNLTKTQLEKIYEQLYYSNQLPWYAGDYRYSYREDDGTILSFTPDYLDETEYDRRLYEQKVAEVLAATVYPGMTDLQIALSVHDYLVANSYYDESMTYYEGYDLLIRGTAVCNGYAEAYMDLLKRAGVECTYVISEMMNHGWNLVKIDGNWYHVDLTWDDPTLDRQGNVEHTYFLLSDTAIANLEKPHYAWEALYTCQDDTYQREDFWDKSSSQVCFESADVAYYHKLEDDTHYICRLENGESRVLYEYDNGIKVATESGHTIYRYETKGLSLVAGRLYFCDGEKVYSINTNGEDLQVEHQEPFSQQHGIMGSHMAGNTLKITTWDLKDTYAFQEKVLENVTLHSHNYQEEKIPGDCLNSAFYKYTCQCGVSYQMPGEPAEGHSYETVSKNSPGLFESGEETLVCSRCGDTVTRTLSPIADILTDWDTMRWVLLAIVALLVIIGKAKKKK